MRFSKIKKPMRRNLAVVILAAPADRAGDRASLSFQHPADDKPQAPASCAQSNLETSAPLSLVVRAGRLHHTPFGADLCVEGLPARPAESLDARIGKVQVPLAVLAPSGWGQVAVRQDRNDNRGRQQMGNAVPKRGKSLHRKQGEKNATKRRQKAPKPHKPQKEKKA